MQTELENQPSEIPVEAESLTDRAYEVIEELIVTLKLAPGQLISEIKLSKSLGIGRTPIREALHRLARGGLVTIMPRRGVMVSEINIGAHLRMLEVRREIERLLARSAAQRARENERIRFAEIADAMRKCAEENDDLSFMRLDQQFNELIVAAARNEFAEKVMGLMSGLSRRFWYMHYQEVADLPEAAARHANVADAVADGDVETAAAASDRLIDYIETITRAAMDY